MLLILSSLLCSMAVVSARPHQLDYTCYICCSNINTTGHGGCCLGRPECCSPGSHSEHNQYITSTFGDTLPALKPSPKLKPKSGTEVKNTICPDPSCCISGYKCGQLGDKNCYPFVDTTKFLKLAAAKANPKAGKGDVCPGNSPCPVNNTCCPISSTQSGCCPSVDATCCSDKKHCCPNGYNCDTDSKSCTRSGKTHPIMKWI